MTPRTSADKSRLLAYIKHTPGFETRYREFINQPIEAILDQFEKEAPDEYRQCLERFEQNGTPLAVPA